jgi:hypothetical protein
MNPIYSLTANFRIIVSGHSMAQSEIVIKDLLLASIGIRMGPYFRGRLIPHIAFAASPTP